MCEIERLYRAEMHGIFCFSRFIWNESPKTRDCFHLKLVG
jgi:hypothetical protein